MTQPRMDPADALAELGRVRLDEVSLDDMLLRVAELAKGSIPGTREVTVTLVRGRVGWTGAFTGELARQLDEWQYEQHRGPCLDASASGDTISVPDMETEERWPAWAERARAAGVRSLPGHQPEGARGRGGPGRPGGGKVSRVSLART